MDERHVQEGVDEIVMVGLGPSIARCISVAEIFKRLYCDGKKMTVQQEARV